MMIQTVLTGIIVLAAIAYLVFRLKKNITKKDCDNHNCGC